MPGAAEVVLERKGIERQPRQIDAGGRFDDKLHALGTLLVAQEPLKGALARPASIAIHDDGHMLRDPRGVQPVIEAAFLGGKLTGTVGPLIGTG